MLELGETKRLDGNTADRRWAKTLEYAREKFAAPTVVDVDAYGGGASHRM
jgi:hypothetical protein